MNQISFDLNHGIYSVHILTQAFAGFEMWDVSVWQADSFTSFGITANTGFVFSFDKAAKSSYLYTTTVDQRLCHRIDDQFHGDLYILVRQAAKPFRYILAQI